ncbi:hypothetical protein J3459_019286 [Metarhizium acridum]|nr:hypothetical protein J3459_019286 [Metarhizium acridum]
MRTNDWPIGASFPTRPYVATASCSRPVFARLHLASNFHPDGANIVPAKRQRVEMEGLEPLINWARTRGVELDGVAPQQMPGRGIGAVATRSIKAGQVLMTIPARAILRLDSRRDALAAELRRDDAPLLGTGGLQDLLPAGARRLVDRQEAALERDWAAFHEAFPGVARDAYLRCWFLVGTRAFYHETDATLLYPWEDRLALLPVADMFNHAGVPGCSVAFSPEAYTVTATRACARGDEVFLSYGEHSNDFFAGRVWVPARRQPVGQALISAPLSCRGWARSSRQSFGPGALSSVLLGRARSGIYLTARWMFWDVALPRSRRRGQRMEDSRASLWKRRVFVARLTRFLDEIHDVKSAIRAVTSRRRCPARNAAKTLGPDRSSGQTSHPGVTQLARIPVSMCHFLIDHAGGRGTGDIPASP